MMTIQMMFTMQEPACVEQHKIQQQQCPLEDMSSSELDHLKQTFQRKLEEVDQEITKRRMLQEQETTKQQLCHPGIATFRKVRQH